MVQNGFRIFENLRECSETVKKYFQMFLHFFIIFGKSSEIFGSVWKTSETVQKCSSDDFLKFSEYLRKSLEVFESLLKRFKSVLQMFL